MQTEVFGMASQTTGVLPSFFGKDIFIVPDH